MEIELERSIDAQICGYVGRGVLSVRIDDAGHLIFTMSDGSELDLGPVIGSGDGEGDPVELDTTLTRAGMAAEAKATGDAIAQALTRADSALQEAQSSVASALDAQETATAARQTAQNAAEMAQTARQTAQSASAVANQAISAAGDLDSLATKRKTDLVSAINELHGNLISGAGGGGGVGAGGWVWSDEVEESSIPLSAFPAAAAGIRLRVYCYDTDGQMVSFAIQPPYEDGFTGGNLYGFTWQGTNVSFEDTGSDLVMTTDAELMIFGFYYTTAAAAGSGAGIWWDTKLARGVITAGANLTTGLNTGLTLGHLRSCQRWLFRYKNAGKSTLTDFYLKVGPVANIASGTSILRNSTGGASVFYEWWDIGRTKLAVQSVFVADPAKVDDAGTAVASAGTSHWMFHNLITPGAIDKVADLSAYDDDTPVWICCTAAPSMDYEWEFRGVTR